MLRPRSRSPHYAHRDSPRRQDGRRFPWDDPDFNPQQVLADLGRLPGEDQWVRFMDEIHPDGPEGHRRPVSPGLHRLDHHLPPEEFHHRRIPPAPHELGYAERRRLSPHDGRGGGRGKGSGSEGLPHSPQRLPREKLPSLAPQHPHYSPDHHQIVSSAGWRREEQDQSQGRSRDRSPRERVQGGGKGERRGGDFPGPYGDRSRDDMHREKSTISDRNRREADEAVHPGYGKETEFRVRRPSLERPREGYGGGGPRGRRGPSGSHDGRGPGTLIVEHDHGIINSRGPELYDNQRGRGPDQSPSHDRFSHRHHRARATEERLRKSGSRSNTREEARGRLDHKERRGPVHEERRGPVHEERRGPVHEERRGLVQEERRGPVQEERRGLVHEERRGPVHEERRGPVHEERRGPVHEERRGPVHEERRGPVHEERRGPVHEERRGPVHEERRGPVHEERRGLVQEERRGPVHEERRGPAHEARRGPAHEERRGPAHEERRGPAHEERRGPAHEERRGPVHEERRGPAHEAGRGPAHEERRGPAHEERRGPAHEERRGPVHEERRGPAHEERRGPAHEERRGPAHEERRGPAHEERRGPAHEERRGPVHEERRGPVHEERRGPVHEERRGPIHESRRSPDRHGRASPMGFQDRGSPTEPRARNSAFRGERGAPAQGGKRQMGPSMNQPRPLIQGMQGYRPRDAIPQQSPPEHHGYQPRGGIWDMEPREEAPGWAEVSDKEPRCEKDRGPGPRGGRPPAQGRMDPRKPQHSDLNPNWNQQQNDMGMPRMGAGEKETLTIKVDMNRPVGQNSQLCYSSDRQLSLDLVNVGRQRLDFLPMLEHSGTYRESAMHSGTFAQEIITLVHQVKEHYFRGDGVTLNERFSGPQDGGLPEEEEQEEEGPTLNRLFNMSMSEPDMEPVFSKVGRMQRQQQAVRDPGDLRHDLERRRQERLEGVKVTIPGGRLSQHPLAAGRSVITLRSGGRVHFYTISPSHTLCLSDHQGGYGREEDEEQEGFSGWSGPPRRGRRWPGDMGGQRRGGMIRQDMGDQQRNNWPPNSPCNLPGSMRQQNHNINGANW
ncbi:thyroid hormone receptor-associated protein 3-like isoform X7 [Oncorhynchus keta]|uniref:thyroid hormone receptor-associated protein 3-like isoform X7 n=1 Tax=Oncorhynchus keta TaxID=8018 RepID=UPI00227CC93C|nr:thyroid hormone receptor-associated protein 3-like isoform X7 [Oncorhynchus keta]